MTKCDECGEPVTWRKGATVVDKPEESLYYVVETADCPNGHVTTERIY